MEFLRDLRDLRGKMRRVSTEPSRLRRICPDKGVLVFEIDRSENHKAHHGAIDQLGR